MYNIGCDKPLGVQSGWVVNSQMRASSVWSNTHAAWRGRLNMPKQYSYPGAWCARVRNAYQWLEVRERDKQRAQVEAKLQPASPCEFVLPGLSHSCVVFLP